MTNNSISAMNDYLFQTLDALTNDSLSDEELEREIKRADAVVRVSNTIIESTKTTFGAMKMVAEYGMDGKTLAPILGGTDGSQKKIQ